MMKKLKIRMVVIITVYAILAVVLSSCGDRETNFPNFPNCQSTWVVTKIEHENKVMASYRVETTDKTDFNTKSIWLMDSIGKFEMWDTLVFCKSYLKLIDDL